jgi:3-methyladenine DNA glycosylase AlkD
MAMTPATPAPRPRHTTPTPSATPVAPSAADVLARLRAEGNPDNLAGMARFGIATGEALGVTVPFLRGIAKELRPATKADPASVHALAADLWTSGVHEARILAGLIDPPALVTPQQADAWVEQIDSWDVCDLLSGLWEETPFAVEKAYEWSARDEEFVKRSGLVIVCALTVHDKKAPDELFLDFLKVVERESCDDRNFVKKAVNWVLRQIGKRNMTLHAAAVEVGARLRESECRAARWIASDALRELNDPKVVARIRS